MSPPHTYAHAHSNDSTPQSLSMTLLVGVCAGGRDGAAALLSLFNSVSAPDSPRGPGGQQLPRHRRGGGGGGVEQHAGDYFGQVPGQVLFSLLMVAHTHARAHTHVHTYTHTHTYTNTHITKSTSVHCVCVFFLWHGNDKNTKGAPPWRTRTSVCKRRETR